ncbi:hypothetical protein NC797_15980 [Aquibacillus sp. 3ASR75-11]|uniref:Stage II sporulation protein E N-terminal domain-containing protein n=1 Tax=Terrihalobacillus insolitus TaxID=2950438 RepID=A0A9X3WZ81_9BACI|nr:hypothetical protein [Terrihalobacillus insolitus]MDC3426004.1 hypothetical protein [Terrihalobacillus insolitus]
MIDSATRTESKAIEVHNRNIDSWKRKFGEKTKIIFLEKGWLLFLVGFLLGRAIVLSSVSPFALSFLASVWFMRKEKSFKVVLAAVAGALTYEWQHGVYIAGAMLVFLFFASLFNKVNQQQKILPIIVLVSTILARAFYYSILGPLTPYNWTLIIVEGVLSAVLVLIFMQSIPLLSPKRYKPALKNEEIVCMIILLASVLTGMIGWEIQGASFEQISSRYLVLWLAYVGGAAIGSTVGVVAGLILSLADVASLYQMSLLAFSSEE